MQSFTDIWQYMPHGMCLLWQPWLVILWAGSDLLIFAAYSAIPFALLQVVRQRSDMKHKGLVMLFAGFILLCGLTHLLSIVTLWIPIYPMVGLVKLATGLVSATTAVVLFRLVPVLVAFPSHAELEEQNARLSEEIEAHERTLAELRSVRDSLEEQVGARTAELQAANTKLATVAREAVHRSRNLLTVVGSIARQSAKDHTDTRAFMDKFLGRLSALNQATSTVLADDSATSTHLGAVVRKQLASIMEVYGDRVTADGDAVITNAEAAQQISLAIHELATNAQKYGALSDGDGGIEVSWRVESSDNGDKELVLCWDEDLTGREVAALQERKGGFGTRLLIEVVPTMLQGEAKQRLDGGRLIYELRIPLWALAPDNSGNGDVALAARIVDRDLGLA